MGIFDRIQKMMTNKPEGSNKHRGYYKGLPNRDGISKLREEFSRQQAETKEILLGILESLKEGTLGSGVQIKVRKGSSLKVPTAGTSEAPKIKDDFFDGTAVDPVESSFESIGQEVSGGKMDLEDIRKLKKLRSKEDN